MLLEIDCDSPYILPSCLHDDKHGRPDVPPEVVCIGKKRVSFNTDCQVLEYQSHLSENDKSLLWYNEEEMEDFRFRRTNSQDDPSETSSASAASAYNHTRRVLLQFETYKSMGHGSDLLRDGSRKSSKKSRDKARKKAVNLSKAINTYYCSKQGMVDYFGLGLVDRRLTDYYLETILDMLLDHGEGLCRPFLSRITCETQELHV